MRYTQPVVREMLFPSRPRVTTIPDAEFTAQALDSESKVGRAWKATELRLKSFDDLHKLWYVLLKEKLALKSDIQFAKKTGNRFYGSKNLVKIKVSMARLLTVINERKILLNEFRNLLEDQYIWETKKQEEKKSLKKLSKTTRKFAEFKPKQVLEGDIKKLTEESVLSEKDIELIKDTEKMVTQKMLLKKYISNWKQLNGKQRKIALAKIHAVRAK